MAVILSLLGRAVCDYAKIPHITTMEQVAQTVIECTAAIVALWLLLFLGAERLLPATTRPDDERRVGRNAGLWLVNTVMSVMIILPLSAGPHSWDPIGAQRGGRAPAALSSTW